VTLVGLLVLAVPSVAVANPAVDEYSLNLPDSKGKVESPEQSPTFNPAAALPTDVVAGLERNPSGKALAVIATSRELGAPSRPAGAPSRASEVEADQPSALSAVGGTIGDPAAIGLLLLLVLIGGAFLLVARAETRRRGQ
jgi:hypothetical protein